MDDRPGRRVGEQLRYTGEDAQFPQVMGFFVYQKLMHRQGCADDIHDEGNVRRLDGHDRGYVPALAQADHADV